MKTSRLLPGLLSAAILVVGCGEYTEYIEETPDPHRPTQTKIPEQHWKEYQILTETIASYHETPIPQNIGPDHAQLHTRLAIILYEAKDWRGAKENLERGINMYSGDPEAHWYLGKVLGKLEQYEAAVVEFETALKLDPDLTGARRDRAETYRSMGRMDEAEESEEIFGESESTDSSSGSN
jgi:tetratricopeptide (TPR) repeat protein